MKRLPIILLIAAFAMPFAACKKEGCTDATALNYDADADDDDGSCEYAVDLDPSVEITAPVGDQDFGDVTISFTATDDVELASYTMEVVKSFETLYETSGSLSGTEESVSGAVTIDPFDPFFSDIDAYGSYTVNVEVTDTDGKSVDESSSFKIEDSAAPEIREFTVPNSIAAGDLLKTTVVSFDASGIQQVSIELWTVDNAGSFINMFDDATYSYADGKMERTTIDNLFGFENPLVAGDKYQAKVTVTDETGLTVSGESNVGEVQ